MVQFIRGTQASAEIIGGNKRRKHMVMNDIISWERINAH